MTVPQFADRLKEHLNVTSVAAMDAGDRLRLSDAVNAGLQDFYLKAPPHLKRGLLTKTLPAPRTVSIGLTQGSRAFTIFTAAAGDIFQTVVVQGIRNRILTGSNLLYPWDGATGTYDATIYGDAVTWGTDEALIENLSSLPIVDDTVILVEMQQIPGVEIMLGRPECYAVESYGQTLAARPFWTLRVWPLPDVAYRFSVSAQLTAFFVQSADLTDAGKAFPVEERMIARFLLPMALFHLTTHRLWKLPETQRQVQMQYELAVRDIGLLPTAQHLPRNSIGTPRGY